jgi:hypothetical protein
MDLSLFQTINLDNNLAPLDAADAKLIFDDVRSNPKESVGDFDSAINLLPVGIALSSGSNSGSRNNANGGSNNAPKPDTANFVFASNWFELDSTVTVGDTVKRYRSLINRAGDKAKVERRSDANF